VAALLLLLLWQAAAPSDQLYEQGVALFQQGRLEEALPPLREAVRLDPSARNWRALGVVYAARQDFREAEPAFQEACRLAPHDELNCYYLGRSLYALDRHEASLDALKKALPVHPRRWRTELAIAQALEALGRAKEAEEQFRKAIRLAPPKPVSPDFDNPSVDYGIFLYRQGRLDEALASFAEGVRRAPDSAKARYQYGRALLQAGKLEEAVEQLQAAVAREAENHEAHLALSRAYFRLGRIEEGERHSRLAAPGSSTLR
jgi:protein O-GlcNAc transferase